MIRHGQASFGSRNYDRLSPVGVIQAGIVADYLVKSGRHFDAVYSGALERQQKTAQALLNVLREQGLTAFRPITAEAFNEYDSETVFVHQIGLMKQEDPSLSRDVDRIYTDRKVFQRLFQQAMTRWASGKYDAPGSPAWRSFRQRVHAGIREVMQSQGAKKRVAVFTSGGPISAAVQLALDLSDETAMSVSWQIMNASVTRFKYNAEGIALAGFNDISHLLLKGDNRLLTYR